MLKVVDGDSNKTIALNERFLPPVAELTSAQRAILDAVLCKDHEKVAELVAIYKKKNHNVVPLPRKPIELLFAEESQRIRKKIKNGGYQSNLEAKALLAIIDGDFSESDRIIKIMEKRNNAQMRVISSAAK